jgi:hypothetical protein
MRRVQALDWVSDVGACPVCGSPAWVVDGDGYGKWWLLCAEVSPARTFCVNTRELPEDIEVVHD